MECYYGHLTVAFDFLDQLYGQSLAVGSTWNFI